MKGWPSYLPRLLAVAERSSPSQSARTGAMGAPLPSLEPVDSPTPHSASLSYCPLCRHSSLVRAVCVNALVRISAGGDQPWSSLPRQLSRKFGCVWQDLHLALEVMSLSYCPTLLPRHKIS